MEMFCYRKLNGMNAHDAGRNLLSEMYWQITGEPLPEIRLGKWGKPYFPNSTIYFSISHTNDHVFCAISREEIGIDAEELDRRVSLNLAEKILSPNEYAQYMIQENHKEAILKFWVMKEAYLKYKGIGLTGYPNQTDFTLSDLNTIYCDGCVVAAYEEEGFECSLITMPI